MKYLTNEQIRAIKIGERLGGIIAKEHPEIADEYRPKGKDYKSVRKIAKEFFEKHREYGTSDRGANNSIIYSALEKLLNKEELREIGKEHRVRGCKKTHKKLKRRKNKRGIFGLTIEQRRTAAILGAVKVVREKLGFHGVRVRGGEKEVKMYRKGIYKKGQTPYNDLKRETEYGELTERRYIIALKKSFRSLSDFRMRGGWTAITEKVNSVFRNNRRLESIRNAYFDFKYKKITTE